MVYNQNNYPGLRDRFADTVESLFNIDDFVEKIETDEYDCYEFDIFYNSDDECYIIDRETGNYVNWYKFTHIGRDIHMNFDPKELSSFLIKFKNSRPK